MLLLSSSLRSSTVCLHWEKNCGKNKSPWKKKTLASFSRKKRPKVKNAWQKKKLLTNLIVSQKLRGASLTKGPFLRGCFSRCGFFCCLRKFLSWCRHFSSKICKYFSAPSKNGYPGCSLRFTGSVCFCQKKMGSASERFFLSEMRLSEIYWDWILL